MSIITRILAAVVIASLFVGPASAATKIDTTTTVAQGSATQTGTLTGTVNDSTGAPVPGVLVQLHGVRSYNTTTDAKGTFAINDVAPGLYSLVAQRPGYETATEHDLAIVAGVSIPISVTMSPQSFTSLRTIASVRTVGRGTFNQGTASVSSVSAQDYADQGSQQVTSVLNELPGVQISLPNNSGNGAVPGAITFANIRDALSYETATLIDGHPLSVGKFGDYVTTFLNPFMLDNTEVVKGPGAMAPQVNYAIGGTINFRTKDPTLTPQSEFSTGINNRGGTFLNFGVSDTVMDGKIGFVAAIASYSDPSAVTNQPVYYAANSGVATLPNGTRDVIGYNDNKSPIPGTSSLTYNNYSLLVCCFVASGDYNNLSELLKVKLKFSNATRATLSYFGGQTTADQNGNTSQLTPSIFQPPPGYTGSLAPGTQVLESSVFPISSIEHNNEPILQGEVSTVLGNDTLLGRYYHATIARTIEEGGDNSNVYSTIFAKVSGVNTSSGTPYNDITVPINYYGYFRQTEYDKLDGLDLQYAHPYGEGNSLTGSISRTNSTTTAFTQGIDATTLNLPTPVASTAPSVSIPTGSDETFTTFMLRDTQNFGSKLNVVGTLYSNLYRFTAASFCTSTCLIDGSNSVFTTTNKAHFDERVGATYRATSDLIIRGAMGSAIAPPYIGLLTVQSATPTFTGPQPQSITAAHFNPNLVPETAFGYDLGADLRVKQNYYISGDVYLTNLFNQYSSALTDSGKLCTPANFPGTNCSAAIPTEVFFTENQNLANSRYEGLELSFRRVVSRGIGFTLSGSTQRGYTYNLPPGFYCSTPSTTATPCTASGYNTNLAITPNTNFTGCSGLSTTLPPGSTAVGTGSAKCIWNQSVPYLQGNAEINWHSGSGWYASFGGTLFGKNNSLNEPPFAVARFSLRAPLGNDLSFQISGNNVFNAYRSLFPIVGGGIGIPLVTGQTAATNANVLGPATWNFILVKGFGRVNTGREGNSSR